MEVQVLTYTSNPDNQKDNQIIYPTQRQKNHPRSDSLILSVRKKEEFIDFYLINLDLLFII